MPEIIRFPTPDSKIRLDPQTTAFLKILLLAVITIGAFIFHVWFRTYALTEGFEVADMRRALSKTESDMVDARLRKNQIMGPQSLKKLAQTYRGQGVVFEAPRAQQVFYYRDAQ